MTAADSAVRSRTDILVVGGGFFGMYLAEYLQRRGAKVTLCEREEDFMLRASYRNQARVHNGYHYPRSILTAMRSHHSFPRFSEEFSSCIDDTFDKYYLVSRMLSNVTASQFRNFCVRLGLPCDEAPAAIRRLVSPKLIESVFAAVEYAFDACKLKQLMLARLEDVGVELRTSTTVHSVRADRQGLRVELRDTRAAETAEHKLARHVFNCTYAMTNSVVAQSEFPLIPLKHELTEYCLVEPPDEFKNVGLTVMCGPFFSTMPFPSRQLHSFSHVRYTPHYQWHDSDATSYLDADHQLLGYPRQSNWRRMICDARRYIPALEDCKYRESLWEVKTVLPRSEVDDSRPILFRPNYGVTGFHCVLGGKIDNVYDVIKAIEQQDLIA